MAKKYEYAGVTIRQNRPISGPSIDPCDKGHFLAHNPITVKGLPEEKRHRTRIQSQEKSGRAEKVKMLRKSSASEVPIPVRKAPRRIRCK